VCSAVQVSTGDHQQDEGEYDDDQDAGRADGNATRVRGALECPVRVVTPDPAGAASTFGVQRIGENVPTVGIQSRTRWFVVVVTHGPVSDNAQIGRRRVRAASVTPLSLGEATPRVATTAHDDGHHHYEHDDGKNDDDNQRALRPATLWRCVRRTDRS
jgi:hypothetical protein